MGGRKEFVYNVREDKKTKLEQMAKAAASGSPLLGTGRSGASNTNHFFRTN
jgi:hypothetical protein